MGFILAFKGLRWDILEGLVHEIIAEEDFFLSFGLLCRTFW